MKVEFPHLHTQLIKGAPGGGALVIDELDAIVRQAFAALGSPHHPMDAPRYLRIANDRRYAPTGRCYNCVHVVPEDCGAPPEILGEDFEFEGHEGDWSPCPFWEENPDAGH